MTGSPTDDPRPNTHTPDSAAGLPTSEPAPTRDPMGEPAVSSDRPAGPPPAPLASDSSATTVPAVSASPEPEPEPEVRVADVIDRSTVRRAPRFGRFILAGVALGAVLAVLLAFLTPPSLYARTDLFWILFLGFGFFCGIAAAGLAVVLDRRSLARREHRTAARRTPPAA